MLALQEQWPGNVLEIKASGKLTHAVCQQVDSRLADMIRRHRKVRVLFEMEKAVGWELGALWDELKFWFNHGRDIERCAVVGETRWQQRLTQLSRPFLKGKYFDRSEREQAGRWVREGAEDEVGKEESLAAVAGSQPSPWAG